MKRPLEIRLLGPVTVARAGEPVALPRSQKTRALLAYLVMTQRAQSRERLCELFWDATDDPRGALRWSLSKLRVLDDVGAERIHADRQTVRFELAGARVDAIELREAIAGGLERLSVEQLRALASEFRGGFLEGLELPDFDAFQAWRAAERGHFRELHVRLLRALVERLEATPEEAILAARELVNLCPEDETSRATLIGLLAAAGHREEAEEHYQLGKKQIEKSGADLGKLREAWRKASAGLPQRPSIAETDLTRQEIRFCKASDGVRIAWAAVGQGPPLLKTAN